MAGRLVGLGSRLGLGARLGFWLGLDPGVGLGLTIEPTPGRVTVNSILHIFGLPTTQPRSEQLEGGTTE